MGLNPEEFLTNDFTPFEVVRSAEDVFSQVPDGLLNGCGDFCTATDYEIFLLTRNSTDKFYRPSTPDYGGFDQAKESEESQYFHLLFKDYYVPGEDYLYAASDDESENNASIEKPEKNLPREKFIAGYLENTRTFSMVHLLNKSFETIPDTDFIKHFVDLIEANLKSNSNRLWLILFYVTRTLEPGLLASGRAQLLSLLLSIIKMIAADELPSVDDKFMMYALLSLKVFLERTLPKPVAIPAFQRLLSRALDAFLQSKNKDTYVLSMAQVWFPFFFEATSTQISDSRVSFELRFFKRCYYHSRFVKSLSIRPPLYVLRKNADTVITKGFQYVSQHIDLVMQNLSTVLSYIAKQADVYENNMLEKIIERFLKVQHSVSDRIRIPK